MQYVKDGRPNNVNKLTEKFSKDIKYANKFFPDYEKHFMLWTPIVKRARPSAKHDQMRDIEEIKANLKVRYGVNLECIINEKFAQCLSELRHFAGRETKELKSPVLRFIQVEEYSRRHVDKLSGES